MNVAKLSQKQRQNIKHDLNCKCEENMTVSQTDIIFQSKFQIPKMNAVKLGQKQRHTIKHDLICKFE